MKYTCYRISLTVFFLFSYFLSAQPSQIVINEFLASNKSGILSPVFSEHADWIELANFSSENIDLGGCFLTDDLSNPAKWTIPANTTIAGNGYLLFWADDRDTALHTNFKLSQSGESIGLFTSTGIVIDTVSFGFQYDDISYGRIADNILEWSYFSPPSPNSQNKSSSELDITSNPQFFLPGGFYTGQQTLTLSGVDSSVTIRYSIDGSPPDTSSPIYSSPIILDSTTAVRARAFQTGKLPSQIITATYFINETIHLPIVSLVTDPKNFFDDMIGIYITGTNGIVANCDPLRRNLNQDWERPINIEHYETTGQMRLNQGAGVKIYGGCARTRFPEKSLSLFARSEYGKGSFDYQFFPSKAITNFEAFLLRSSGDDQVYTMFRDGLAQTVLWLGMHADIQAYRPAAVFLNGAYWGIHNIREKVSEHFIEENFLVPPEEVNLLERNPYNPWNVKHGSAASYNAMMDYIQAHDMASDVNYDYVKTQMDIDQYIDYQIGHIYLGENDWPSNNIQFWKANSGKYSRWRWINHDMDWSFMYTTTDYLSIATATDGPVWPNPPWSTLLFRKLLENSNFKNEFIQRYAYYLSTIFKPENIIRIVDSLQSIIAPEIPRHITRWGGKKSPDTQETWMPPTFNSVAEWEANVDNIRVFCQQRPQNVIQHILDKFGLSGTAQLTLAENIPSAGKLKINGLPLPDSGYSALYFKTIPLKVTAVPLFGYRFASWTLGDTVIPDQTIEVLLTQDTILTANYEPAALNDSSLVIINEINYNSSAAFDPGDWIELYNRQNQSIDLSGWRLTDENESNSFTFPQGSSIEPHDFFVLCNDLPMFQNLFPTVDNVIGSFPFGLKNGGEVIRLYSNAQILIDSVHYDNKLPWPLEPDGSGRTLELTNPWLNNDLAENWTASTVLHGTPGSENSVLTTVHDMSPALLPERYELFPNYPNPFNPSTTIRYSIKEKGFIRITIYNILGQAVRSLVNQELDAGIYSTVWNGQDNNGHPVSSGTYLYILAAGGHRFSQRMMLLK
jgi:hypothetical protein